MTETQRSWYKASTCYFSSVLLIVKCTLRAAVKNSIRWTRASFFKHFIKRLCLQPQREETDVS